MAIHNGGNYIKVQLESLLCQLSPEDEVVISDDGSTDNTIDTILNFQDSRIKVYHFSQSDKTTHHHLYVTRNFEHALKRASGGYIFLYDQDDYWQNGKLAKCSNLLKNNMIVLHDAMIVDDSLHEAGGEYIIINTKELITFKSIQHIMDA